MVEIRYVGLFLPSDRLRDHGSTDLSLPRENITRDLTLRREIIIEDPSSTHLAPYWEIVVMDPSSLRLTLLPRQIMRDASMIISALLREVIRRCRIFVMRSLCPLNLTLRKESIAGTLDLDLYRTFLLGLARGLALVGWYQCFQQTFLALMARLIMKVAREKKTVHR
jgi:hypothetical protein